MKTASWLAAAVTALVVTPSVWADQSAQQQALMTKGKLETDLGNFTAAGASFQALANDQGAPEALRWEAHVRLGVAQSAGGDRTGSLQTFSTILARYGGNPQAMRFATGAVAAGLRGKVWPDWRAPLEDLLRTARVVSVGYLSMPESSPRIVRLQWNDFELRAGWKIDDTLGLRQTSAELAAYGVDRLIDLDMVPPTVPRTIEGEHGRVQFWVNGVHTFKETRQMPDSVQWQRQVSRMKVFDCLIGNTIRNLANMIVDDDDNLMLVDHERAFTLRRVIDNPPSLFDRKLIDRLKTLDMPESRRRLRALLRDDEVESLLARRDALLAHLEKLIAERGEAAVVF